MSTAATTKPSMRAVLADSAFRKLWLAQFVSIFGDFLALFGVISLITFRWHGTVVQVTYVTIAFMLPMAVIGPLAGVFVDRWNVKRVMIASDLVRSVLALMLVLARDVWHIAAIFFVLSIASSFFAPAQSVTIRTIVPRENLLGANALMSQAFYTVRLISPTLAGALVAWLSEKACFYIDAATFLFSAAMLSTIVISREIPPRDDSRGIRKFFAEFTSGNRFIFTHTALAFVVTAMVASMFVLSCFGPLVSIYVRDTLAAGSFLFGVISSMVGVGLIIGTQLVQFIAASLRRERTVLAGLLGLAIGTGLLAAFGNIPVAGLGTFFMGFAIAFVIVPAQTLMQQETPPAMLGRVSSSFMSLISFAQVFGLLLSGMLAHALGIRHLFAASAGALVVLCVIGYFAERPHIPAAPAVPSR